MTTQPKDAPKSAGEAARRGYSRSQHFAGDEKLWDEIATAVVAFDREQRSKGVPSVEELYSLASQTVMETQNVRCLRDAVAAVRNAILDSLPDVAAEKSAAEKRETVKRFHVGAQFKAGDRVSDSMYGVGTVVTTGTYRDEDVHGITTGKGVSYKVQWDEDDDKKPGYCIESVLQPHVDPVIDRRPLEASDVPPGSVFRGPNKYGRINPPDLSEYGILVFNGISPYDNGAVFLWRSWQYLMDEGYEILRPGKTEWESCSKPSTDSRKEKT